MSSVIICEKPSQAQRIRAVIGSSHGRVLSARGHLLRLEEPEEVNPDWKKWTDEVLVPPSGLYGHVPDEGDGKSRLLEEIGAALKDARRVIIATDTDREGQLIGESIVRHFGFEGEVMRAWWKSEDEKAFRHAFANLEPNEKYRPLYECGLARAQADQIFNLTLTRVASNRLRPEGWKSAIGIGRVKTPTLGIVCKRELEIRNFVSRDYFEVSARIATDAGAVELWHRPRGETRLFENSRAEAIRAAAAGWSGPIHVTSEHKRALPPKPLDMTALQKLAGPWGWSAQKVLEVTQSLYETHTLVTYPRAESRYLPENITHEAPALLSGLAAIEGFAAIVPEEPHIRGGKSGTYSNAGLNGAPHHAIIPNINVAGEFAERYGRLNADERRIFDAIARAWLAAVSPDHEFDETVMEIAVPVAGEPFPFSVRGRVETKAGWKRVFDQPSADEDDGNDDEAESGLLAPIADGTVVNVIEATAHGKKTEAPKRYTEGELPSVMQAAWKFVEDPAERERLKETNGIGTPATRASIIEGLKAQGFLAVEKARIVPTDLGLWLYQIILGGVPELVDPGATARLEERLNAIYRREATADEVIRDVIGMTGDYVSVLVQSSASADRPHYERPPTTAMLDAVKAKAKREGVKLAKEVTTSFAACRAFLGPLRDQAGDPSDKQVAFAQKLAAAAGTVIADDILSDTKKLSAWIDAASKERGAAPASEKQLEWIKKLVGEGAKAPKGYPDGVSAADAKQFLDKAFEKKKSKGGARRKT